MNLKFPFLIAAGLFIASSSKAQYNRGYADNRVIIQGKILIPGRTVIGMDYDNRDRHVDNRDWRAGEYERYCRDHREYRGDRRTYYRDHSAYRFTPNCATKRVVAYRY